MAKWGTGELVVEVNDEKEIGFSSLLLLPSLVDRQNIVQTARLGLEVGPSTV